LSYPLASPNSCASRVFGSGGAEAGDAV
jgi:hypothetical protein